MQVTQFACGGFVVGFRFSHAVADGPGAAQFMSAMGEIARGRAAPSLMPAWGREAIPSPPAASVGPLPVPTELRLQYLAMDISTDYIDHFKARFLEETGHRCSAFEVLIAKAWQARTRAAGFARGSPVHVCFAMNARPALRPRALPDGFYGNCYYIMRVSAPAEAVSDAPLNDVVRLIREGKKRLPSEFARWSRGEAGGDGDPYRITSDYRTLLVSDWSRLGFAEVDYGWGAPVHVVPLTNLDYIATCILVRPSAHKPGARLITQCVAADGVDAFHRDMMRLDGDPYRITSDYRTLLVSDWSRLGFAEVDYGWGAPVHVVPLTNLDYIATCILVRPSAHKPGARLITQCVAADGVDAFHRDMMRLD